MTEEALREWLRANLEVTVESVDPDSYGSDVYVGIRFRGEKQPFTHETIPFP